MLTASSDFATGGKRSESPVDVELHAFARHASRASTRQTRASKARDQRPSISRMASSWSQTRTYAHRGQVLHYPSCAVSNKREAAENTVRANLEDTTASGGSKRAGRLHIYFRAIRHSSDAHKFAKRRGSSILQSLGEERRPPHSGSRIRQHKLAAQSFL